MGCNACGYSGRFNTCPCGSPNCYGGSSHNRSGRLEPSNETLYRMMEEILYNQRNMSNLVPVQANKNNKMSKVGNMMQRLLDADTQKMVKAGFINGDLELTDNGKKVLWAIIFSANKAEFVKEADAAIAEAAEVAA